MPLLPWFLVGLLTASLLVLAVPSTSEAASRRSRVSRSRAAKVRAAKMRKARLARISLVAQGAMNSLNPVKRIKEQIALGLRDHGAAIADREFGAFLSELLERVGLRPGVANMYPHELRILPRLIGHL